MREAHFKKRDFTLEKHYFSTEKIESYHLGMFSILKHVPEVVIFQKNIVSLCLLIWY